MAKRILITLAILLLSPVTQTRALQDPTRPTDPARYFGVQRSAPASAWTLQSILSSRERRIAVINGQRVREGDRIGAARVVRIEPSQVVLHTGDSNLTLRLWHKNMIKVSP